MRSFVLPAVAALLLPMPALAADDNSSQANERRICKIMPRIGSRLNPRRICLTRNEWDQVASESRRVLGEFVQRSTTGSLAANAGKPK